MNPCVETSKSWDYSKYQGAIAPAPCVLDCPNEGKLPTVAHIEPLKPRPARKGFLKPKDFKKFLIKITPNLQPLLLFLYYCGVRLGEARQVQWLSVDLGKALIVLHPRCTIDASQSESSSTVRHAAR
jgi:integrase